MYNVLEEKGIVVFTKKGVTIHNRSENKFSVRLNIPSKVSKQLYESGPLIVAIFDDNYSIEDVLSMLGEKITRCNACNKPMTRKVNFVCDNTSCKLNQSRRKEIGETNKLNWANSGDIPHR